MIRGRKEAFICFGNKPMIAVWPLQIIWFSNFVTNLTDSSWENPFRKVYRIEHEVYHFPPASLIVPCLIERNTAMGDPLKV